MGCSIFTKSFKRFSINKGSGIMKNRIIIFSVVLFGILSCTNDDDNLSSCDQVIVISSEQYANAPADKLTINSLEINGDCLKINFSSSGCSGDTWKLKLIDSEVVLETNPPQRNLRLSFKNEEACEAYITKEITFDIKSLQFDRNQLLLNITNSGDQILYEY
jgi:hypothetical protein